MPKVLRRPSAAPILRRPAIAPVSKAAAGFWERLKSLKLWLKAKAGKFPHQKSSNVRERGLAFFINKQREKNRNSRLPAELADALEELDGWSWNTLDQKWLTNLELVRSWIADVPVDLEHVSNEVALSWYPQLDPGKDMQGLAHTQEVELAKWVHWQKFSHSNGRLREDRQASLQALPGWSWSSRVRGALQAQQTSWEDSFQELLAWPTHRDNDRKQAQPRNWSGRHPHERRLAVWFDRQVVAVRYALAFTGHRRLRVKSSPKLLRRSPMAQGRKEKVLGCLRNNNLMHLVNVSNAICISSECRPFPQSLCKDTPAVPLDLD